MLNLPEHKPIEQKVFKGLYSRGIEDAVPPGYFSDCLNVKFAENEVDTRDGSEIEFEMLGIVRAFRYKRLGETPRFIALDATGNLYDSLFPNNPIYTDAAFTDFSMVNYNNRAYITPHDRTRGLAGKSLLVYEGTGVARLAGGAPPSGFTLVAANSAIAGNVEEGIHIIAVAYLSSTGFVTAPGPAVFAPVIAPGEKKIDVSSIPIGPDWVAGRVLLATRSIPVTDFTGNQYGYEFYFVPNGTIHNNTDTTLSLSFYDADLLSSADYLIDNLSTIPAGLGLVIYNSRLALWAPNGLEHTLRLSAPGEPETFNNIDGFLTVDPSEAVTGVRNAAEFRKSLIIFKSNRTYATSDNGDDPSTWEVNSLDKSAGTECFGVANVLDARGTNNDRLFFADRSGLICFEGFVKRPELSYNIESIWQRINKAYFSLVQVVDDAVNHRLYITVPLDAATAISHVLFADYSKSFTVYGTIDEKAFKWAIWAFPNIPTCILGDSDVTTFAPVLYISQTNGMYGVKSGLLNDFAWAIDSWFKTEWKSNATGWINHFGALQLSASGTGILLITLYSLGDVETSSPPSLTLATTPGKELTRLINFKNEGCSIKFRVASINEHFHISRIDTWTKPLWLRRPG